MIFNSVDNRLRFNPIRTILVEFANENDSFANQENWQKAVPYISKATPKISN